MAEKIMCPLTVKECDGDICRWWSDAYTQCGFLQLFTVASKIEGHLRKIVEGTGKK